MRWLGWLAASVGVIIGGGALAAWVIEGPEVPERDISGLAGDIDRGAYLARLAGCIPCHTDVRSGGAVLAGEAEIETEFGSFYAPNITPHAQDGIGRWTVDDFARALTAGESPDGRHYYPSFPYTFYTRLTDQDIVDLWAAVMSVPPVAGGPPSHDLGFPFSLQDGIGGWKRMFFYPGELPAAVDQSDAWNRGRYLARGPAHCGACHTPRNILGGRQTDRGYSGGIGQSGESTPSITPEALAANGWTASDLTYALRTGILPDGDVFGGSMAEVVRDGTQYWSDADLAALAEYILSSETNR